MIDDQPDNRGGFLNGDENQADQLLMMEDEQFRAEMFDQ